MEPEEDVAVVCPFCGESLFVRVDRAAGDFQEFVYDCEICCRPLQVRTSTRSGGEIVVEVGRGD